MTRALKRDVGTMTRAQDIGVGMQLIGPEQRPRTRHRDCVPPPRTAFGGQQVVPTAALVEMRRLREADRSAGKDVVALADERSRRRRVLLQHDAGKAVLSGPVVPQ